MSLVGYLRFSLNSQHRIKILLQTLDKKNPLERVILKNSRNFSISNRKKNENEDKKNSTISIGDVSKKVGTPKNPELVPIRYLPRDKDIPPETLKSLKWMMQKDILGQDIFLIGRPSPQRRTLALQYLELTRREMEFVALSRDTTESDLKQRREIRKGTAHYIDQSAVKAASQGRILVLEGIEKAERNVLPVLNNLLENREMHLEDGRLLIPSWRYDKLLKEHTQEELDEWKLVRVSEDFRVIALGLPVPKYLGNPLDPPLRSRFQARDVRHLPFKEQLEILQTLGSNLSSDVISQVLSFAHTMVTDESSNLGLPDFPTQNLPELITMMNNAPQLSLSDALSRLYPYKTFLAKEGQLSVEDTMTNFQIPTNDQESKIMSMESINTSSDNLGWARAEIKIGSDTVNFSVPAGPHDLASMSESSDFVPTSYHSWLLSELLLSHAVKDFCIIGPKGCGKSVVLQQLADLLGYETEPIMLYQDMTARDLLQQRTTLPNGDTIWRNSPLIDAAIKGKMAVLDGIHRIHRGTLAVLHRLVHDRELQLYDGTRLIRQDRYDALKQEQNLSDEQMREKRIFPVAPSFRIAALAEPPKIGGSSKEQWLTPEILSMFLFHNMRPLSKLEEELVLTTLTGKSTKILDKVLTLTHKLRQSGDASLNSIANSLSTRQLLRVSKRLHKFEGETAYSCIRKACLTRFLPSLPRETLEGMMTEMRFEKPPKQVKENQSDVVCKIEDGLLTIGSTSTPVYVPDSKTKIPETLFYDTVQNVASMEAMLQDFLLGEHLLLVGNQGVGKNKLVDRMLNLLNRPREYIQLHRDTTVQSLTLSPTVREGIIVYEDSPLVKAVKTGHILVVDEADKAPTHVTCILKTLVESGEMILSDGRRIVAPKFRVSSKTTENLIKMHPDFRMIVLANRPGFPFLGNDFFGSLGDLFSCHAIDNPSMDSEMAMLKLYGPNVPEDVLRRLVKAFSELRSMADEGQIQYPYSTREVVNIVRHLEKFPNEGLGSVVRNVFDFDSYSQETWDSLEKVLHNHGIPIGTTSRNIGLAREFPLPEKISQGTWKVRSSGKRIRFTNLPIASVDLNLANVDKAKINKKPLDRVEARGVGFSEMQSFFSLPFHDFAVVGDVKVERDELKRQLYDKIHVCTANPLRMYSMKPLDDQYGEMSLQHLLKASPNNILPRIRLAKIGPANCMAIHEEVTRSLFVVDTESGQVYDISSQQDVMTKISQFVSTKSNNNSGPRRMLDTFAEDNQLIFFSPNSTSIELYDLRTNEMRHHSLDLPIAIRSVHPLNQDQYLVVSEPGEELEQRYKVDNLFILKKEDKDSSMPHILTPIESRQQAINIFKTSKEGLNDFGLQSALGDKVSTPHTLMTTDNAYASLVLGFPELEFSENEVISWPKSKAAMEAQQRVKPSNVSLANKKFNDPSRNIIFLKDSCQIVKPVSPQAIPSEYSNNNFGLDAPGNISSFLEVVDLMSKKLRYVPIPESAETSNFSSWYKQTYPDQTVTLAEMSNEGLVSVDNSGTVRLWETGVVNLERSLEEWRRMLGDRDQQLTLERDKVGELGTPKHGKMDEKNNPHVGGNQWAGGTGGRDTAGLGGMGGPYRLDAGHDVHQVSDELKQQIPEHIQKAAREMNRKAFEQRLREIQMSEYDANLYEKYASQVRKQVTALKTIINGLQAKSKDRQWLKNQTSGELDDTRLIEGITGEKSIYKKRAEQEPEPGTPLEKPKRLRLVVDVSGSMYRFNGHDQRLERTMESALLVMEALDGYNDKIKYDIVGHSGDDKEIPFCTVDSVPKNEKERLDLLRNMHAHSQFCMSGDHTLPAAVKAISDLAKQSDDHDESIVIVMSDANFDRYGISPKAFAKILKRNENVEAFAIFIGSLGDQADRLTKSLPSGKAFVCLDTKKIPEIMKTIFTSTMLK